MLYFTYPWPSIYTTEGFLLFSSYLISCAKSPECAVLPFEPDMCIIAGIIILLGIFFKVIYAILKNIRFNNKNNNRRKTHSKRLAKHYLVKSFLVLPPTVQSFRVLPYSAQPYIAQNATVRRVLELPPWVPCLFVIPLLRLLSHNGTFDNVALDKDALSSVVSDQCASKSVVLSKTNSFMPILSKAMFKRIIMDKDIISHIISDGITFNGTVLDRSIFNRVGLDESASSNMFALVKTAPVYAPTQELAVERHSISKITKILEAAQASILDAIQTIDTMEGKGRLFKAISLVENIVNDAVRIFDNVDQRAAVAAAMQLASTVHAPVTHAVSMLWSLDNAFFGAAQITQIIAAAVSRYIPGLPVDIAASAITRLVIVMTSPAVCMVDRLNASDIASVALCLIHVVAAKTMPLVMGLPEDTRRWATVGLARALYSQITVFTSRIPCEYLYSESSILLEDIVLLTVCKVYSMSVVDAAALVLDVVEKQASGAVERLVVEIEASNDSAVDECVVAPTDLVVERRDSATALKEEDENLITGFVAPANTAEDLGVNPGVSADYRVNSDGASTSAAAAASKPRSRVSWTTPIEACKKPTDGAAIPVIKYKKTRRSPKRSKKNKDKGKEVEQLDIEK